MANYELIFDLGSAYSSAALKKDGFTDKIPSVVAYGGADGKQVLAVGVDAVRIANSAKSGVKISHPILEGAIIDVDGAKAIISSLLSRLINYKMNAFSRYNVACIVPCGMISSDKNTIESAFLALGARQVGFIEAPIADSFKLFNEFHRRQGVVVDIGYDCADLALVAANTIVAGCTVYHAGKHLTETIAERIKTKYMIQLSYDQAEYLKLNCASLYPNDSTVLAIEGYNIQRSVTESVSISSKELYDTLADYARSYVKIIQSLVASVPEELATSIQSDGVMLCGGGARLAGLDMFLQGELGLPIRVASLPDEVSVSGLLEKTR